MRNIFIVGGIGSQIGRALVNRLLREDTRIISTVHTTTEYDEDWLRKTDIYRVDVTDSGDVKELVNRIVRRHGPVDVLINNAGVLSDEYCSLMHAADWQKVIDVNLTGVFNTCKYVSRKMIPRQRGKIINIASYKGLVGCRRQVNYSAAKAGVIALTKSLARELAAFNITVNAVCPGFIPSKLNSAVEEKITAAKAQSLMGIRENMNDLVNFVAFACSDEIRSVTGQVFCIDSRTQ